MSKFDAGRYLAIAEAERVTHTMLVPVQYQRILAHPDFARRDLSAFGSSSRPARRFGAALKRELLDRWPGRLVEVYGLTEGGCTCILERGAFRTSSSPSAGRRRATTSGSSTSRAASFRPARPAKWSGDRRS